MVCEMPQNLHLVWNIVLSFFDGDFLSCILIKFKKLNVCSSRNQDHQESKPVQIYQQLTVIYLYYWWLLLLMVPLWFSCRY